MVKIKMYFFGASGHGKVVAEIAEENGIAIVGFIDQDNSKSELMGYPVIHETPHEVIEIIITIGNNRIRKGIVNSYQSFKYRSLIHPNAFISKRASISDGTVIMSGVTVNSEASIGNHCIINTNCSIDHECYISDYVHLSPNVGLAGNVTIGEGTHVGIGANVIQGITIGKWCTIGAGAVIIKDIPDGCTVVGNPGKILKQINI